MDREQRRPAVGAVAKVVEPAFCISKKSTGGGAHAVAIGAFNDVGGGGEGGHPKKVIFRQGPKPQNHQIGFLFLPPSWRFGLLRGNERDGPPLWIVTVRCAPTDKPSFVSKGPEPSYGQCQVPSPPTRAVPIRKWGETQDLHGSDRPNVDPSQLQCFSSSIAVGYKL